MLRLIDVDQRLVGQRKGHRPRGDRARFARARRVVVERTCRPIRVQDEGFEVGRGGELHGLALADRALGFLGRGVGSEQASEAVIARFEEIEAAALDAPSYHTPGFTFR